MKNHLLVVFMCFSGLCFSQSLNKNTWIYYDGDTIYCSEIKNRTYAVFPDYELAYTTLDGIVHKIKTGEECRHIPFYCLDGSYFDYVVKTQDTINPKKSKDRYCDRIITGKIQVNLYVNNNSLRYYFKLPDGLYYKASPSDMKKYIYPVLAECEAIKNKYGDPGLLSLAKENILEITDLYNTKCGDN